MTGVALCNGVFITDNCKSSSSQCHQTNLYAGLAKEVEKYIHTQSLFRVPTLAWKCPVVRRTFENLAKISGARKTRQQWATALAITNGWKPEQPDARISRPLTVTATVNSLMSRKSSKENALLEEAQVFSHFFYTLWIKPSLTYLKIT